MSKKKIRPRLMLNILLGWIAGSLGAMAYHLVSPDLEAHSEKSSPTAIVQEESLAGPSNDPTLPSARGGGDPDKAPSYIDQNTIAKVAITSDEERELTKHINEMLAALRERESSVFERPDEEILSHEFMVHIPGDAELASELKERFFTDIRELLGERRARLYIASTRDATKELFGSYGGQEKRIWVSFDEGQNWFHEREGNNHRYFRSREVPQRFSHIFAVDNSGMRADVLDRE